MFQKFKINVSKDKNFSINNAVADCIPIAFHYDSNTLITKNADLVQIIEVKGFEANDQDFRTVNLRDKVREVIKHHIKDHRLAVSLQVLRNRRDMTPTGEHPFGLAKELDEWWKKKNNWDKQLNNSLYISIVYQGIDTKVFEIDCISTKFIAEKYTKFFTTAAAELHKITNAVTADLKKFSAKKLGMVLEEEGYISEPLSLYHNLTHLAEKKMLVPIKDLSESLANFEVDYHFNTLILKLGDGSKRYAAVFSAKQVHNLPPEVYDNFLQLGIQFIISEVFYFTTAKVALKEYSKILDHLKASQSLSIAKDNDIDDIMNADNMQPNDYCEHQVTIVVYSDDEKFFQDKINRTLAAFREIGVVLVREDFNMARCFWSQLPGNFRYINRKNYTATDLVGAFASIHHKNMGCYNGSKWGAPITIFRNLDGKPFYFNFHHADNGNTIIIGPSNTGKTTLMNFFITQALKLNPRMIYIDLEGNSEKFIDAIGGLYVKPDPAEFSPIKIKLLDSELFQNNKEALYHLLVEAIYPEGDLTEEYQQFFKVLVDRIFFSSGEEDKIEKMKEMIYASEDELLKNGFDSLLGGEAYQNFFDEDFLDLFSIEDIISIDCSMVADNKPMLNIYLAALLLKLPQILDERPTIIAINRSYNLFYSDILKDLLKDWLDLLPSKNAIAFFSSGVTEEFLKNEHIQNTIHHFTNQMFLSNKYADKSYRRAFGLSDEELQKVKSYDVSKRIFLLKQANYSIVGGINLDDSEEFKGVLSCA